MHICALGQDSHRFEPQGSSKPLVLGGVTIHGELGLAGNSDADVVLHAITNAVSGLTGVNILGKVADDLCKNQGITDSRVYLARALESLSSLSIVHVSVSVEAKRPHLAAHIPAIRDSISKLLSVSSDHVGFTATSGEGLTAFGRGEGIQVLTILTAAVR